MRSDLVLVLTAILSLSLLGCDSSTESLQDEKFEPTRNSMVSETGTDSPVEAPTGNKPEFEIVTIEAVQRIFAKELSLQEEKVKPGSTIASLGGKTSHLIRLLKRFEKVFGVSIPRSNLGDDSPLFSVKVKDWFHVLWNLQQYGELPG
ncbi:MAG: acyl carrier protein [Fuerstiella sp.]